MPSLWANSIDADLSAPAAPRNPPALAPLRRNEAQLPSWTVQDMDDVDDLVRSIQAERTEFPIRMRQCLKLNAKLIGINFVPVCGHALDDLFCADAAAADRSILGRYVGRDEAAACLARHRSGIRSAT